MESNDICNSPIISNLLQSFIYAANDSDDRRDIINYYIGVNNKQDTHQWLGTWHLSYSGPSLTQKQKQQKTIRKCEQNLTKVSEPVVEMPVFDESIDQFVAQNMETLQQKPFSLFTVCVSYDGNSVHFVSYVYERDAKKLASFDPGVEVYHHGQKTIVPCIRMAFHKAGLISKQRQQQLKQQDYEYDLGRCTDFTFCGKNWGIQYNGNHASNHPMDAFCQSWTLFFLIRTLYSEQEYSFVNKWCKISPNQREFLIIIYFIIPSLNHFENFRNHYIQLAKELTQDDNLTFSDILDMLYNYATNCHMSECKIPGSQKISCPRKRKQGQVQVPGLQKLSQQSANKYVQQIIKLLQQK